jgi:hypothetical protein
MKRRYRVWVFDRKLPNRAGIGRFVEVGSHAMGIGVTIPSTLPGTPIGVLFGVVKRKIARFEPPSVDPCRLDGRRILLSVDANAQSGRRIDGRLECRRRNERVSERVP